MCGRRMRNGAKNKDDGTMIRKITALLLLGALTLPGQETARAELYHSGEFVGLLRTYPVPPGTLFGVRKAEPERIAELLRKGEARIAVTTRPPPAGERRRIVPLAYRAPVLAVHPGNKLRDITAAQARELLERNLGSWRTFGGPRARIHLYVKADPHPPRAVMSHSSPSVKRSWPRTILDPKPLGGQSDGMSGEPSGKRTGGKNAARAKVNFAAPLRLQTRTDGKSFSLLRTDPYGLACFDITRFDEDRVPLLKIDGAAPTLENFRSGAYPLTTTYYLVAPKNPTGAEEQLIRYLESGSFALRLYQAGFLPAFLEQNRKTGAKK